MQFLEPFVFQVTYTALELRYHTHTTVVFSKEKWPSIILNNMDNFTLNMHFLVPCHNQGSQDMFLIYIYLGKSYIVLKRGLKRA